MGGYMPLVRDGISTAIPAGESGTKVIVRSNQLRQHLNIATFQFAQSRKQTVYIFMASHYWPYYSYWRMTITASLWSRRWIARPGLFLFAQDMPIVINQNLYTSLGIVNGKEAIGVHVVIDESATVYFVSHNVWIFDSPPKCLFKSRILNLHQCKVWYCQYFLQVLQYKSPSPACLQIDRNILPLGTGSYHVVQDLL